MSSLGQQFDYVSDNHRFLMLSSSFTRGSTQPLLLESGSHVAWRGVTWRGVVRLGILQTGLSPRNL